MNKKILPITLNFAYFYFIFLWNWEKNKRITPKNVTFKWIRAGTAAIMRTRHNDGITEAKGQQEGCGVQVGEYGHQQLAAWDNFVD